MTLISFTNQLLAFGTVVADIFIVISIIYFIGWQKKYPWLKNFLAQYGLWLALLTSTGAMLASLFYSEIAGFEPCELCWYQRIFMYPLVILLAMAIAKKDWKITDYALGISGVGFLIALYHNYVYYYNEGLNANCVLFGSGVSCVKRYVFEFGYVTIPIMSLTAFALIILLLLFYKIASHDSNR